MNDIVLNDLVEWDPELTPEAEAYAAQIIREVEPQVALMRRIRMALGLSQVELAAILQVTQSNVSKMEGRDNPSLSTIARMVESRGGKVRLEIETAEGDELRFAVAG